MEELVYDKEYHYIDSISVWLDMDSVIYIFVILMLAWGITCLVRKKKAKSFISLFSFMKKYLIFCALPVFLLFFVQLVVSGMFIPTNIIITFLPLLYAVIAQLICISIGSIKKK